MAGWTWAALQDRKHRCPLIQQFLQVPPHTGQIYTVSNVHSKDDAKSEKSGKNLMTLAGGWLDES